MLLYVNDSNCFYNIRAKLGAPKPREFSCFNYSMKNVMQTTDNVTWSADNRTQCSIFHKKKGTKK